jgi:hypothetical protein
LGSSGSYARGDQPRSVLDPDAGAHAAAAKAQLAYNDRQAAEIARKRAIAQRPSEQKRGPSWAPDVAHPGALESVIPVWGSGREALADLHDGDYLGAAGNGVMAVSDLALVKGAFVAVGKGAMKVGGSYAWRSKPWDEVQGVRKWMGEKGYLKPGEHGHHGIIPQGGWGKAVPDYIKNQPWNIKALDPVTHRRIHGRATVDGVKAPRFNPAERVWRGTPTWTKPAAASGAGDLVRVPTLVVEGRRE